MREYWMGRAESKFPHGTPKYHPTDRGRHPSLRRGEHSRRPRHKPSKRGRVVKGKWTGKAGSKFPPGTSKYHPGGLFLRYYWTLRTGERSRPPRHRPLKRRSVVKENWTARVESKFLLSTTMNHLGPWSH